MRNLAILALAIIGICCSTPKSSNTIPMYVGTFTNEGGEGFYMCQFDTVSGAISDLKTVATLKNSNYLTVNKAGDRIYTYNNIKDDSADVVSYSVDPTTGVVTELNRVKAPATTFSYVSLIGGEKYVGFASYSDGKTAVFPLADDGSIIKQPMVVVHKGSSVHPTRQDVPHAHSILEDTKTGLIYVPDFGTDRTYIYAIQGDSLATMGQIAYTPGEGPRHVMFNNNGKYMVTVNELGNTVSIFGRDSLDMFTDSLQVISTLPAGFVGETTAADVHFSKDGRFMYASNRGADNVAIYSFDPETGAAGTIGFVGDSINYPRNFCIDPTGKFMLVANQKGASIVVYSIDKATGALTLTSNKTEVKEPACIKF